MLTKGSLCCLVAMAAEKRGSMSCSAYVASLQLKIVYSEFGNILFTGRYRKVASLNTSRLEAHVGLFRLLMKEILNPYVL